MKKIKWGIIGPGSIANNFAEALNECYSGELAAIASHNDERRKSFGDKYSIENNLRFNNYDELLNSEDIDAVYISTPHTLHAELSIKAAGRGKHILCEKPAAVNFNQGEKVINAVREAGVFYKEGFMYRCHPQIPALLDLLKSKVVGNVKKIKSSFGFDMTKVIPEHRLFNRELAGGAILDVGLYPVSFSRMIAAISSDKKFINPTSIIAKAEIGQTGVDEISYATMKFDNGVMAEAQTAIMKNMDNNAIIECSEGDIIVDNPWMPGRDGGPYKTYIRIIKNGSEEIKEFKGPEHLFFFEAELSSQSILKEKQQVPHPGMTWEDTLGNLKVLDQWRQKVNYSIKEDNL